MARLIDADKINTKDVIGGTSKFANDIRQAMQDLIDNAPTVDAEPVRRGKWIEVGSGFNYHFECSKCGWKDGYPFNDRHKYCPNCGAKMEEEIENG